MRLRRLALVGATASLAVLTSASPASAHISQFDVSSWGIHYVDDEAHGAGTITCDAGERFRVGLLARQPDTGWVARGVTDGVCTGSEQGWFVRTTAEHGDAQFGFETRFRFVAQVGTNGTVHEQESVRRRIKASS